MTETMTLATKMVVVLGFLGLTVPLLAIQIVRAAVAVRVVIVSLLLSFATGIVCGQENDEADLAKSAQNPISDIISLPLQNNTNFGIGPDDETQNVLNVQPVWPIAISAKWNLITRTIAPVVSQPGLLPEEERTNGLGDISFTAFFSPKDSTDVIWGVGPVVSLPTATDEVLGSDKWSAGPSVVFLTMPSNWVLGALLSNMWSFAGSGEQDVNLFLMQYFVNFNFPGGWYLTTSPIITSNWEAESGDKWTVPFGGGVGKIFRIGKQPMNSQIQAFYNVTKPELGADWTLRIQVQFLFPK